jgi:hypothetical protein
MRECTCEYNDGTSDSSLMSKDDCDKFDRTARSLGTGYCYYE